MTLSPNPVSAQTNLTLPSAGDYEVRVLAVDGRAVSTLTDVRGTSVEIDGGAFPKGMYFVEVVELSRGERAVVRMTVQ